MSSGASIHIHKHSVFKRCGVIGVFRSCCLNLNQKCNSCTYPPCYVPSCPFMFKFCLCVFFVLFLFNNHLLHAYKVFIQACITHLLCLFAYILQKHICRHSHCCFLCIFTYAYFSHIYRPMYITVVVFLCLFFKSIFAVLVFVVLILFVNFYLCMCTHRPTLEIKLTLIQTNVVLLCLHVVLYLALYVLLVVLLK